MLSIDTNSDIDDYKESIVAGLNLKETLWAGLGILSAASVILILTMLVHIPLTFSIYIGSPAAVPFILTGFFQKDGMSFWQRFRRKRNKRISRPLGYVSTECKSCYQTEQRHMEVKEKDENEEFEHLLKRMKLIGVVFAVGIITVVVLVVVFMI